FLTGHGLGASGGLARMLFALEAKIAPDLVNNNPYLVRFAGGDSSPLDHWLLWTVLGLMAGGFVSGLIGRRVRVETQRGPSISAPTRLVFAVLGGVLVGYAAQLARGCTSGQALSGGAVLSAGSWAFMFCVFGGGYAIAWFVRRLWN
ncbi:MAG: YeeE/YedE family protein, partial [Candidatus Latescibacterota bacterium]